MSESKRTSLRLEPDNVLSDDEVEDNVSTNSTPEDSKDTDTLLRRLKKALRLAGKLQSKVEFERQVSKELARRNEQLKKELETKDEVYIALKESFQEMFIQFDDLLVRYDDIINEGAPAKGSAAHMEAMRDYDDKIEFLQNIRSRSGVDKTHRSQSSGRGLSIDEDHNVNLLHMSGSSFFRTSLNVNAEERQIVTETNKKRDSMSKDDKKSRSFTERLSISNTIGSIQKLVQPPSSPPEANSQNIAVKPNPPKDSINKRDTISEDKSLHPDTSGPASHPDSFTNTPLFEHFLVIGVPIAPAAEMADQINRQNETFSDRLKNQMGSFWKKSTSSSNLGTKKATPVVARASSTSSASTNKKTSSLAGKWGELSKNLKSTGNQGGGGGIFDMNILPMPSSPTKSRTSSTAGESTEEGKSLPPKHVDNAPVSVPVASTRNSNMSYTEPTILYRFPPDADPPPAEVCDFCLPAGGRLRHLAKASDREQSTLEMLYGHGQSQRSSRCFIFVLEDKTLDINKNVPNEETGEDTGRLFGICVVNPRLLNPYAPINNPTGKHQKPATSGSTSPAPDVEFEAAVCYCFITRFPLFDFFFQILWNIIAFERISRMIDVSEHVDTSEIDLYRYIPDNVYDFVMNRLSIITPPRFGETISLDIDSSLPAVLALRTKPDDDLPEYFQNSAAWALPPLVHWLDAKTIVWALSLLLSEVKLIILGKDAATVSCAVIGLTALLKPFQWVSPMIPILPIKHLDFIESPVPIIAGIVLDNDSPDATAFNGNSITPLNILRQCDDGDVISVLDLSNKEIFTLSGYKRDMANLLVPEAGTLIDNISSIISSSDVDKMECNVNTHPPYKVTSIHLDNFKEIQSCVHEHMKQVGEAAKQKAKEVLIGQVTVAEEKVKAQLQQLSSLKEQNNNVRHPSGAAGLFGTISENKEEDDDDYDEDELDDMEGSGSAVERQLSSESTSSQSTMGSGYTIPILSLTLMKLPTIRARHIAKFYERFVSTQTYAEYDYEFEKLLQSVEAAVTGDKNDEESDNTFIVSRNSSRLSTGRRSSTRKSILLGGAVIKPEAKKSRGRSLYIKPSDSVDNESDFNKELRLAQESAINSIAADEKSSLKSSSSMMMSQKATRRQSRAQSDSVAFMVAESKHK